VLREFDAPDIGMVAMPYLDFRGGRAPRERQHEGHGGERVVAIFTACAYAVRRDAFLGIGGYRESLRHYSEEADCAIRALDQGWFIRAGTSPPVHHRPEPRRSESFSRFQAIRNFVLTAWYDVPLPWVLLDILWWPLGFMVRASRYPPRNLGSMFRGLVSGFSALRLRDREPVSRGTSRAFHAMMREGGLPLERARALRG
jgi:hypothetical protein